MFTKKLCLIALILSCFLFSQNSFAQDVYIDYVEDADKHPYDYKYWERKGKDEQKIFEIGFKLLNANKFPRRVRFILNNADNSKQKINASARYYDGTVTLYKGMLLYIEKDDELAAVLAHELGHIKQYGVGFWPWKRVKMFVAPKYYEYDADIKGIDYMVKAGYNPLAMISLFNKIGHEKSAFAKVDFFLAELANLFLLPIDTHPTGSKRILNQYRHIQANYPRFLNEETENIYCINFLMNSEKDKNIKTIKDKHKLNSPDLGENL